MSFQQERNAIFRDLDKIFLAVLAVLFLFYLASGIFVVEANEKGVIFRFGAKSAVVNPGIGYRWTWPIETVRKVNVKEVQRIEVDFSPRSGYTEELLRYCLTGDKNIIHNYYVIQYRISDPANFLTSGVRVQEIILKLAQATILEAVAAREVDPILTSGKREMEMAVLEGLTERLEKLNLKIQIVGVERQSAEPPNLVKDAFQDVTNAREEKRSRIHEADNYKNQEIPKAKGQANTLLEQARAYKFEKISSAKGESERFVKLYNEYKREPRVTRKRLFLEMAETALPRAKILVMATDKVGRPIRVKLLQSPVPTTPRLLE